MRGARDFEQEEKSTRSEKPTSGGVPKLPVRRTRGSHGENVRVHWVEHDKAVTAHFGSVASQTRDAGATGDYWTEFVFEAYVSHQTKVILLARSPDVAGSRPHTRFNSR